MPLRAKPQLRAQRRHPRRRIVAIAFDSPLRAQEALLAALHLQQRELLDIHDAVFINRSASGRVEIVETSDPSAVAAAVPTSLLGALIGTLLAGPLGLLVGGVIGGGGGALAARLIDTGIPDQLVHELGDLTAPGQTALALLVSDVEDPAQAAHAPHGSSGDRARLLMDELRRFQGARVVYADVPPAALEAMRQALAGPA